jgi:uncharacterized membrane protein YdjX (TVP38/TMEM64 family)
MRIPRLKPAHWLGLALGASVALAVIAYVLHTTGALAAIRRWPVKEWVRQIAALGPVPYMLALAVLPAVGAPVTIFYLLAGAVFAHYGGLPAALAASFAAIGANIALTYAMGRWLMHPVIERLAGRFGWKVPQVRFQDRWAITLLVRITPGPPFFAQSYVLALGRVPFGSYMIVSCAVAWTLGAGVIVLGDSLASGRGGMLLFGLMLVVAVVIGVRIVRRYLQQRRPEVVAEAAGGPPAANS